MGTALWKKGWSGATHLAFNGRRDVLVRKDGAGASAEPAYDAQWWLGEVKTGAGCDDAR